MPTTIVAGGNHPPPSLPAVGFGYLTARDYCRYLGKHLPEVDQWQKAFRGGLDRFPADDVRARRTTVWFAPVSPRPANLAYAYPVLAPIAPVGSFPEDTSPVGVIDLAGNVSEWSATPSVDPRFLGLRIVLGANWGSPPTEGHHLISWRNARADLTAEFGIGVRCVGLPP